MRRVAASCLIALLTATHAAASELTALDWLAGHWAAQDGTFEEVWLAPSHGSMVGSFRWVFPDDRQVLEFLVIQESHDGIVLRFKHFNPDFEPWEKQAPNTYRMEELTRNSVTFARIMGSDKAPNRLSYSRRGDTLTFVAEGNEADADPLVLEFARR